MQSYNKLDQTQILNYLFHPRKELPLPNTDSCINIKVDVEQDVCLGSCLFFQGQDFPYFFPRF